MLKGTRDGILKKLQPVSIHGQMSWDVFFTDVEDPDGQIHVARVGPRSGRRATSSPATASRSSTWSAVVKVRASCRLVASS